MNLLRTFAFATLFGVAGYSMAQESQVTLARGDSTSSIVVGFEKHTKIELSPKDVASLDNVKAMSDHCEIISYKFSLSSSGGKKSILVQGDTLPSNLISHVKSGDKIFIDEVMTKCGKGPLKTLKGVSIKVK